MRLLKDSTDRALKPSTLCRGALLALAEETRQAVTGWDASLATILDRYATSRRPRNDGSEFIVFRQGEEAAAAAGEDDVEEDVEDESDLEAVPPEEEVHVGLMDEEEELWATDEDDGQGEEQNEAGGAASEGESDLGWEDE